MTAAVVLATISVLTAIVVFVVLSRTPRPLRDGFMAVAAIFTAVALVAAIMQGWLASERSDLIDLQKKIPSSMDHTSAFAVISAIAYVGLLATGLKALVGRKTDAT